MGRGHYHLPVMAERVAELIAAASPRVVIDGTFGGGGHARAILDAAPGATVLGLDRDPEAVAAAGEGSERLRVRLANVRDLEAVLEQEGIDEIDAAILDLGVSSRQLDVGERGFSYRSAGPLDMRMGPDAAISAYDVVNHWPASDIADILRRYGEERFAGRIAAAIVEARPVEDTAHLARVIGDAVPSRFRRRGHPARRSFQAIRIAVNDELGALVAALDAILRVLRRGGRLVVISYHSLEDRIVKRRFAIGADPCMCPPGLPECGCGAVAEVRLLTRGAERPGEDEVAANPRARSARLRAVERL